MMILMEILIFVIIVFVAIVAIAAWNSGGKTYQVKQKKNYTYVPKDSVMTATEMEFFWTLQKVVGDRYFIFPQVHLSALLDHRVKGQEWRYAFYHINAKSVDYVLCSKTTLQPIYAIELDDPSHDRLDRIARDIEVERIFDEANVPLVRFRNYKTLSHMDIAHALADARKLTNDKSVYKTLS